MIEKNTQHEYFASCPKRLEQLLHTELENIGVSNVKQTTAGVFFSGGWQDLYKVCLSSRIANRILMPIAREKGKTAEDVYRIASSIHWQDYFSSQCNFVVDFIGANDDIRNTQFGAQKVKDAIVDYFMRVENTRPSISKQSPDVRINVRLTKASLIVSIDMSGDSLHRRGYREKQGAAPLKENLAAALLYRAQWPEKVAQSFTQSERIALIDPMCGSGTLLIEAALMAANIAPGLLRKKFGFEKLLAHDETLWQHVKTQVQSEQKSLEDPSFPIILGYDSDPRVLRHANENLVTAKLTHCVSVSTQALQDFTNPVPDKVGAGLLICNPPYGERLGEIEALREDYRLLGQLAKRELAGWQMAIFSGNRELGKEMRLRAENKYQFLNGTIATELLVFNILGGEATLREDRSLTSTPLSDGAMMVSNRLQKNQRRLEKWRKKENIECYRVYDADMPEYSAAIDVYGGQYHVQEYQAPKKIDENKARQRFDDIIHATVHAFNTKPENVISKTRMRTRGKSQYEKLSQDLQTIDFIEVCEEKAKLFVNLTDYLDTGLFLDHRPLRKTIRNDAMGKRFLNLFCYTASATVHAALSGAQSSVSVDMSNTYLAWAKMNLENNNISTKRHSLVRADCVEWLKECRQGFDLIMLDPPTFSNSKKTTTVLDIQRDHVSLINRCMELLTPNGTLYFSTNLRSFKIDENIVKKHQAENITASTLDPDFVRNTKIHQCWKFQHMK